MGPQMFLALALLSLHPALACLGPPYLLATFHGGKPGQDGVNVPYMYSRDGCILSQDVLKDDGPTLNELRGVLAIDDTQLVVLNAWKHNSMILMYTHPDGTDQLSYGFELKLASAANTAKLLHPYDVAKNGDRIFVSNQDTYSVTSYDLSSSADREIADTELVHAQYSSSFDVRGIAFDESDILYVATEQGGVDAYSSRVATINGRDEVVYDTKTFNLPCAGCIGLTYDQQSKSLFFGSKDDDAVYQWSTTHQHQTKKFTSKDLNHPAGIVVWGDSLFVNSQKSGKIIEFSIADGKEKNVIVDKVPDDLESLTLTYMPPTVLEPASFVV